MGEAHTMWIFAKWCTDVTECRCTVASDYRGINIEPHVIERRYIRGIKNLFDIYLQLADGAMIIDNSVGEYELFAKKEDNQQLAIIDPEKFQLLKKYYDQN